MNTTKLDFEVNSTSCWFYRYLCYYSIIWKRGPNINYFEQKELQVM